MIATILSKLEAIKTKIKAEEYHQVLTGYDWDGEQSVSFDYVEVNYPKLLADIEELEQHFKQLKAGEY